jgi:hypothetical protein
VVLDMSDIVIVEINAVPSSSLFDQFRSAKAALEIRIVEATKE